MFEITNQLCLFPRSQILFEQSNIGSKTLQHLKRPLGRKHSDLPNNTKDDHSCEKKNIRCSGMLMNFGRCTLWLFQIAMENGPFIDGLPIKNGDFPWLCSK